MAESQQNQQQENHWKKAGRLAGLSDDILDAGVIATAGTLIYKLSGGRIGRGRGIQNSGSNAPDVIALKLQDEVNFARLRLYMKTAGGSNGQCYAKHLYVLAKVLYDINTVYGQQFRELIFSGLSEEKIIARLDKLFIGIIRTPGQSPWKFLNSQQDMIVLHALDIAQRVQDKIKQGANQKVSAEAVAREMIDNQELQGSILAHAEERFDKASDAANRYLQKKIQEQNGERLMEANQKKKRGVLGWLKIIIPIVIVLWFSIEIFTASTAPVQKNNTINPIGELESNISKNVGDMYKSVTKKEGE